MRTRLILGTAIVVGCLGNLQADDAKPADVPTAARVAWLKQHTAPLRTINPTDEDFSDLEPIRKAIGDSRIVFLSEQSHGDGATFHARTRVIKFLHQKCGFDMLAFESGLYDCRKAWEVLREGKMQPRDAIAQGVFGIWTGTQELQPMFDYIGKQAKGPSPLEICGFDCQFTGPASRRYLPGDLNELMKKLPADSLTQAQRDNVIQAFRLLARPGTGIETKHDEAINSLRKVLAGTQPSDALSKTELDYWKQFLGSAVALAEVEAATKAEERGERNSVNLRDIQMGKNLAWLANEKYPQRKIIVWAAAFHLMRNQAQVAMVTAPGKTPAERKTTRPYESIQTMGNEAWKNIEKQTYSIFFTAAEGEFQTITMQEPRELAPVVPGSFEDLLIQAGCENAFFDLKGRGADGKWLEERNVARFLGNADHEADWTKICDGVIFTRKQFGATSIRQGLAARYQPAPDGIVNGVPFDRYTTRDSFNRTITYYLSRAPKGKKLPLAVFVQGPGCASVFHAEDGKMHGGLQSLLLDAGKDKVRVLVVEKPGVKFGANPGPADDGTPEFRQENTLLRWVEAVTAALRATHRLDEVDWTRTLVVGHSEGSIVAAHVAAANPLVTHVAMLSTGGASQLFDPQQTRSADFPKAAMLDAFAKSRAIIFAAHGTADKDAPVASFDSLVAELQKHGRDLTAVRLEGADHSFRKSDDTQDTSGLQEVFGRATAWFDDKHAPQEAAIKKDLERMQGKWKLVAINRDGMDEPLAGAMANLELNVKDDTRTVENDEMVVAKSFYRINPSAQPATIDVMLTVGGGAGQTMLGIYEIVDGKFRVCLASSGLDRPKNFSPEAGSGWTVQEFHRTEKSTGGEVKKEPSNNG